LGRSKNALATTDRCGFRQRPIAACFQTGGGFKGSLYEFATTCQDIAIAPLTRLESLQDALLAVAKLLELQIESTDQKT